MERPAFGHGDRLAATPGLCNAIGGLWPILVVQAEPSGHRFRRVGKRQEPMLVQAYAPQSPVEGLDEGVAGGLVGRSAGAEAMRCAQAHDSRERAFHGIPGPRAGQGNGCPPINRLAGALRLERRLPPAFDRPRYAARQRIRRSRQRQPDSPSTPDLTARDPLPNSSFHTGRC